MGKKFEKNFTVNSFFVDESRELTLPNLMCFFQEVAWEHVNNNNCGWDFLQKYNVFWAVIRFRLVIDRMPKWNETIKIVTWGKPVERIVHPRDFEVYDEKGNKIIIATSSWLILDVETFKPREVHFEGEDEVRVNEHAIRENVPRTPKIEHNNKSKVREVLYSDLDMNRHVNNTRYLLWALDNFSHDFHKSHKIKECIINFVSQAMCGMDYYIAQEEVEPNNFVSNIIVAESNQELCSVQTIWDVR
ncbi:hypothetical protein LJC25_02975 [Bacteroidales bacterium OttesenSCG-928-K03]|nr:hypothetical protein [Bacteroidales bacterium OttesenSCG-928-L14]MDL2241038.1 hypothetical protein [Bacteroidales bacterium OttesenSCG-928-K22]MDL2242672.1 hypothetical protein [Bacteroidales bacterium OttesenSCG-928-K03]